MPKRASQVILSEKEQEELAQIIRPHRSAQQMVLRARLVLAAAQGHSNAHIARELKVNVDTVRLWRDRWVGLQGIDLETVSVVERLQDAPRPGAKPTFSEEQRCQIAALACETPQQSERPISQWTGRAIADELKVRSIVTQIFPRHAARLLKKGASNRTASATGYKEEEWTNMILWSWLCTTASTSPNRHRRLGGIVEGSTGREEGHLSLLVNHAAEIVTTLVS